MSEPATKKLPPDRKLKRVARFKSVEQFPRHLLDLYADKHGALLTTTLPDGRTFEWSGSLKGPSRKDAAA